MSQCIQAAELRAKVSRIIEQAGSEPAEAAQVADNLVMANLSGHDSHGVGMVPRYVDAVLEGGLSPNSGVKVVLDTGPLLNLDGQRGYGQITGVQAMQMGIERAKQHGVCTMALSRSHHLGRIGHFAEMAVATVALAPTPAALACPWAAEHHLCSTLPPAAWRKARCVWPTTRANKCHPAI